MRTSSLEGINLTKQGGSAGEGWISECGCGLDDPDPLVGLGRRLR